jgi:6-pyruvoyl-tetrahydropterin synthase
VLVVKGSWPKVTGQISFDFHADHAMPRIGRCFERHRHEYTVTFGWTHEIQPMYGYTHETLKQRREFDEIIRRVAGKYLNDVLPMQPSAEVLALWLLAQTQPAYCDHVIVKTNYEHIARADRALQRSEWMEFLAGRQPDPFSSETFTLK